MLQDMKPNQMVSLFGGRRSRVRIAEKVAHLERSDKLDESNKRKIVKDNGFNASQSLKLVQLQKELGNKWNEISTHFPSHINPRACTDQ